MTTIPEIRRVPNRGTPSMLWGRTHCDKTLLGPINTKTVADNQHPPQIPPMPRQIGNISLGDHDPICVLGKGGAGEIHLVQPRDGGAPLVCKRPVLNGEDPEDIKNSVRWDGIIGFIAGGHKNIVGGLGCSEKGDNLESYFELVEGVNLDKFIRNTPGRKIAPELARAIILEVCDGLQFLHELPVVHRDIKPGNIMVNMTEEGELITVKLIDFGLAQFNPQCHLDQLSDRLQRQLERYHQRRVSHRNITITFKPTAATTYSGTVTVSSNATSGTGTIACSGTGMAPSFAIAVLPDTQYYASSIASYPNAPNLFNAQTNWIAENQSTYNIKFVCGLGDIVDTYNDPLQWPVATNAYGILSTAGIPYSVVSGNHDDGIAATSPPNQSYFNEYFGPNSTAQSANNKSYNNANVAYVTWPGGNGTDTGGDADNYEVFSVSGNVVVILNIECDLQYLSPSVQQSIYTWANTALSSYPYSTAIIVTHGYIDDSCGNYI